MFHFGRGQDRDVSYGSNISVSTASKVAIDMDNFTSVRSDKYGSPTSLISEFDVRLCNSIGRGTGILQNVIFSPERKEESFPMTPSGNVQLLLLRLYNLFRTVQQLHLQVTLFTPFADSFHYLKQLHIFQFHQLVTRLSGQKLKLHVENAIT